MPNKVQQTTLSKWYNDGRNWREFSKAYENFVSRGVHSAPIEFKPNVVQKYALRRLIECGGITRDRYWRNIGEQAKQQMYENGLIWRGVVAGEESWMLTREGFQLALNL